MFLLWCSYVLVMSRMFDTTLWSESHVCSRSHVYGMDWKAGYKSPRDVRLECWSGFGLSNGSVVRQITTKSAYGLRQIAESDRFATDCMAVNMLRHDVFLVLSPPPQIYNRSTLFSSRHTIESIVLRLLIGGFVFCTFHSKIMLLFKKRPLQISI